MKRAVAIAIFVAVACVVTVAPSAMAQAQRGGIRGELIDPAGAVIPNAKVIVTKKGINETHETTANPHGDYSFEELEAGEYVVKVEVAGFNSSVKKVIVKAGRDSTVNFKLKLREPGVTVY
jgi:hypothetical protein